MGLDTHAPAGRQARRRARGPRTRGGLLAPRRPRRHPPAMLAFHDPRLLAALLLGVAACGGKVVETAGTGGASGTSGSGGAGGSAAVDCAGSPPTFPTF